MYPVIGYPQWYDRLQCYPVGMSMAEFCDGSCDASGVLLQAQTCFHGPRALPDVCSRCSTFFLLYCPVMSSIKRRPGLIDRGVPQKRYDDYDVRFEWIFQSKQFFFIQGWLAQQVPGSVLGSEESDEGLSGGHGPEEFGNHHPGNICSAWHLPGNFGIMPIMPSRCSSSFHFFMGVINGHPLYPLTDATMPLIVILCHYVVHLQRRTPRADPTVRFSQLWGGLHRKGAFGGSKTSKTHGPWWAWVKFMTY